MQVIPLRRLRTGYPTMRPLVYSAMRVHGSPHQERASKTVWRVIITCATCAATGPFTCGGGMTRQRRRRVGLRRVTVQVSSDLKVQSVPNRILYRGAQEMPQESHLGRHQGHVHQHEPPTARPRPFLLSLVHILLGNSLLHDALEQPSVPLDVGTQPPLPAADGKGSNWRGCQNPPPVSEFPRAVLVRLGSRRRIIPARFHLLALPRAWGPCLTAPPM